MGMTRSEAKAAAVKRYGPQAGVTKSGVYGYAVWKALPPARCTHTFPGPDGGATSVESWDACFAALLAREGR